MKVSVMIVAVLLLTVPALGADEPGKAVPNQTARPADAAQVVEIDELRMSVDLEVVLTGELEELTNANVTQNRGSCHEKSKCDPSPGGGCTNQPSFTNCWECTVPLICCQQMTIEECALSTSCC